MCPGCRKPVHDGRCGPVRAVAYSGSPGSLTCALAEMWRREEAGNAKAYIRDLDVAGYFDAFDMAEEDDADWRLP